MQAEDFVKAFLHAMLQWEVLMTTARKEVQAMERQGMDAADIEQTQQTLEAQARTQLQGVFAQYLTPAAQQGFFAERLDRLEAADPSDFRSVEVLGADVGDKGVAVRVRLADAARSTLKYLVKTTPGGTPQIDEVRRHNPASQAWERDCF